jgi:hypothetical protein
MGCVARGVTEHVQAGIFDGEHRGLDGPRLMPRAPRRSRARVLPRSWGCSEAPVRSASCACVRVRACPTSRRSGLRARTFACANVRRPDCRLVWMLLTSASCASGSRRNEANSTTHHSPVVDRGQNVRDARSFGRRLRERTRTGRSKGAHERSRLHTRRLRADVRRRRSETRRLRRRTSSPAWRGTPASSRPRA